MMENNRFKPLHVIASKFCTANGGRISTSIIQRYKHCSGIKSYITVSKPYMVREHIEERLHWAVVRWNQMQIDWQITIFSDEPSFTIYDYSFK